MMTTSNDSFYDWSLILGVFVRTICCWVLCLSAFKGQAQESTLLANTDINEKKARFHHKIINLTGNFFVVCE